MNDTERIKVLAGLIQFCPTAQFSFNDDADEGPVGFTIAVDEVCDPITVTAPTFPEAVDKLLAAAETCGLFTRG